MYFSSQLFSEQLKRLDWGTERQLNSSLIVRNSLSVIEWGALAKERIIGPHFWRTRMSREKATKMYYLSMHSHDLITYVVILF